MALTKEDLQAIQNLLGDLENRIDEKFEAHRDWVGFELDKRIKPLEEKISHLPTKAEYFDSMDALMKEIQEYRMERVTLGSQVKRLEKRVETVEAKVGIKNS
ncbi:hypothetical protein [Candidatus Leptofilum sp.]|uniref:hypothetical protein n=1 Tax=Candidatus Leptofilum sp. TaxID=3241576 RepID=UPI003B59FA0A